MRRARLNDIFYAEYLAKCQYPQAQPLIRETSVTKQDVLEFCEEQCEAYLRIADSCIGDLYKGIAVARAAEWGQIKAWIRPLETLPPL